MIRKIEVWFNEKPSISEKIQADLVYFKESKVDVHHALAPIRNAIKDLTESKENLMKSCVEKFQYEVRRAKKEGVVSSVVACNSLKEFEPIYTSYVSFSKKKGLGYLRKNFFAALLLENKLYVTVANYLDKPVRFHLYRRENFEVILLASFPASESAYSIEPKLSGWANRMLHYDDMMSFKDLGVERYNLGGIGNVGSTGNENVIKFKMEMNPTIGEYFSGVFPLTIKGRLFLKAKKIRERFFG